MRFLILLALLVFFFISSSTLAQTAKISGKVFSSTNEPVAFANVLLMQAADSSLVSGELTNDDGQFTLTVVTPGNYLVRAEMIGYDEKYAEPIVLSQLSDQELPPFILTSGIDLDAITVKAEKPLIELDAEKMIINVAASAINAGNSALEILGKAPGVEVNHQNEVSLRGKQGVLIMINGKNQYLSNEDITRMLENMPAAGIEKIEIITNPSAKYDAEGNSGIINIVLAKNENHGLNGRVSSTLRQGIKTSHFHNLNANFRKEKINVFGSAEYYNWGWYQHTELTRHIPSELGQTTFVALGDENNGGDGYNLRLGLDYNLTKHTTVGVLAKWNSGAEFENIDNVTNITGANKPTFDQLTVLTTGAENYENATYNVNVVHNFAGEKSSLSWDADFNTHRLDDLLYYQNNYFDEGGAATADTYLLRNDLFTTVDILASKLDYSWKINDKYNLDAGAKYSMVNTTNGTLFAYQDAEQWIDQGNRSNTFDYEESVTAIYVNGKSQWGKVNMQVGLRVENTYSKGNSITLNQKVTRAYTDLFPSLSISHPIGEQQNISYSYSRRLNRPNYKSLNPFVFYLDEFTFQQGNPFLNPQYSHNLGINYSLNNKLYVSLDFGKTNDFIEEVIEQDSENNVTLATTRNLDTYHSASLSISIPKVINDWWTAKMNYVGFYNDFYAPTQAGLLDQGGFGHLIQLNNEFKFKGGYAVELSGNFRSRLIYSLFEIEPQGSIDFGISKSFFKDQLNVKFGASDLLRTSANQISSKIGEIDLRMDRWNDSRRASLTLGWRFGNAKVKGERQRNTASDDERNRL